MGSIHDLLFDCHGAIKEIIKVSKKEFEDNSDGTLTYEEWLKVLSDNQINDTFYINAEAKSKLINYIFYADFENGVYIPLVVPSFSKQMVEFQISCNSSCSLVDTIKEITRIQKDAKAKQNWDIFYMMIPDTFSLLDFNVREKDISDNKLLSAFETIYTKLDYNCNYISKNIIKRLKKIKNNKSNNVKEKVVTVYRGQGLFSPDLDSVYSWTTDKKTAIRFALIRGTSKCLYRAKVNSSDIIARFNSRHEHEVIVLPEDVYDVRQIDFDETDIESLQLLGAKHYSEYFKFKTVFDELVSLGYSKKEDGGHTLSHAARVLFYTLMSSDDLSLTKDDVDILTYCAIVHDLGRQNDVMDSRHGDESVRLTKDIKSLTSLDDEGKKIADFIVQHHCLSDETSLEKLDKSDVKDKKRTERLYGIFKDLDALDRVRFNGVDLDVKYFRNKEIKKKLFIAAGLVKYHIESLILD